MSKQTEMEKVEDQLNAIIKRCASSALNIDMTLHRKDSFCDVSKSLVEARNELGMAVVRLQRLQRQFNRIKADLLTS